VFLSSLVSILALLPTLTDGLHYWAAVALASGIARQVVRASRSHAWSVTRIATTCMPIGTIVVGLAAVSACWPIVAERRSLAEQAPAPAGPNIVLVVLDTVRAKSLNGQPALPWTGLQRRV
jgi:hypothetical protein